MKVILRENIENLGRKGDIVNVAKGYARNYLVPRKLAAEVTPTNMKQIQMQQKALRKKLEKDLISFKEQKENLGQITLTFTRKTSEKDSLFGSVSVADVREELEKQGFTVDKKKIMLKEPIKTLGTYSVPVKIFQDEQAEITVKVLSEGEEPAGEKRTKEEDKIESREEQDRETEENKT